MNGSTTTKENPTRRESVLAAPQAGAAVVKPTALIEPTATRSETLTAK